MDEFDSEESFDDFNSIAYRDILLNTILGLITIIGCMMILMTFEKKVTESLAPPGNIVVTISWPDGPTDVDLWVYGGNEKLPVGFSNKSGLLFDLLRDDLGTVDDDQPLNYEAAYSHGIVSGSYVFNVRCYTCSTFPVPVKWEVDVNGPSGTRVIARGVVQLLRQGQEITLISFKMDAHGDVDRDSISHVFQPLAIAEEFKRARRVNDQ